MASSALTGDRRMASVRRSGMTSLGKVAAPKPINLPSQRSENHGLDPNVEIVPKGTLGWGCRQSSALNVLGSSTPDGGISSPGRLSSTRPSTAGSDRANESSASAWGSNSRPSSASGSLSSNQTGTSLRPCSAEPRPGSSQLSRFAEPLSDNSVAWGGAGTVEKLAGISSKKDDFSLTSGDFPMLGYEKNHSKNDTQGQGFRSRPGSSSSLAAPTKDDIGDGSPNANLKIEIVNNCTKDGLPSIEDSEVHPGAERWQGGPRPYPSAAVHPHHFDPWHVTPAGGPPGGVWFRGPPGGPYPVPSGGFPMEPFSYYYAQVPPVLANSQAGNPPAAASRGLHPKIGDPYRQTMPEAYMRPGVPLRPGFYNGPVSYEGYYAPPVGYCNPDERDIPFMGKSTAPLAPPAYNRYAGQNGPDAGSVHGRFSGISSAGKPLVSEQTGSIHLHDNQKPSMVLLKQHSGWNGQDGEPNWANAVSANAPCLEDDHMRTSSWQNVREAGYKDTKDIKSRAIILGKESSCHVSSDNQAISSGLGKPKLDKSMADPKLGDEIPVKLETNSVSLEAAQPLPFHPKDPTLILKIEGLNAKARASDGWNDSSSAAHKVDQNYKLDPISAQANAPTTDADTYSENPHRGGVVIPASHANGAGAGEKSFGAPAPTGTVITRRGGDGLHGRSDHFGEANLSSQAVGWQKKSEHANTLNVALAPNSEAASNVNVVDHSISTEATEKSLLHLQWKGDGESSTPIFDPADCQAQREMMKELARQKAKQLQKEEEERTREQKAKARAKLEELNRRAQAMEGSHFKNGDPMDVMELAADSNKLGSSTEVGVKLDVAQVSESSGDMGGESAVSPENLPSEGGNNSVDSLLAHNQSSPSQPDHVNNIADAKTSQRAHDASSRQKRSVFKHKQIVSPEKNSAAEMSISRSASEAPKTGTAAVVDAPSFGKVVKSEFSSSSESCLPNYTTATSESSIHPRRKNTRNSKNRQKVEEASSMVALPMSVPMETLPAKASSGSSKLESYELMAEQLTNIKSMPQSPEQHSSLGEEGHMRVHNQWKPQNSRKMPRNSQVEKEKLHGGDSVVWAPVRSRNKIEAALEVSQKNANGNASSTSRDLVVQNNPPKTRRAEMERYVPKPVAKELAQQSSNLQPASPLSHVLDEVTVGVEGTQSASVVSGNLSSTELRSGEGKQNNQAKAHKSWRQRISTGLTFVEGSEDASLRDCKNFKKPPEKDWTGKPDSQQPEYYDEWNPPDGWNIPPSLESVAPVTVPAVKDLGAANRGKRSSFRGSRAPGNNIESDHRNSNSRGKDRASTHVQSTAPSMGLVDATGAVKENRGAGERLMSQWLPKSQTSDMTENQRGNVSGDQPDKGSFVTGADQSTVGHHDNSRRMRKGRPRSPKHGNAKHIESTSAGMEIEPVSGFPKNGNQNCHFGRGWHDEWAGQENRQHYRQASPERPRHNLHYEYQPIGVQNDSSRMSRLEGEAYGPPHAAGSKVRERGEGHSRRRGGGNFRGPQTGSFQSDSCYGS